MATKKKSAPAAKNKSLTKTKAPAAKKAPAKKAPAKAAAKPAAKPAKAAAKPAAKPAKAPPAKGTPAKAVKTSSAKSAPVKAKEKPVKESAPKAAKANDKAAKAAKASAPKAAKSGGAATGSAQQGKPAPSFTLADQSGKTVSSAELAGKPYVLYFYPKDNTPGCTTEACDFRDSFGRFEKSKVRVFGVSPDSSKSHAGFASKFELPFTLLADTDKSLVNAYGVWVKKLNYGREYMGVERSTFLVAGDGTIAQVWRNVRVKGHVDQVLEAAQQL